VIGDCPKEISSLLRVNLALLDPDLASATADPCRTGTTTLLLAYIQKRAENKHNLNYFWHLGRGKL
jgi:hypothetical protein